MPRAGLTPERVADEALTLLEREGEAALTLSRLAREVGVKPPSLYNHVGGIEDLRRSLRLRGLEELAAAMREAAVGLAGRSALHAAAHAYRRFARRNPGLYRLTLQATVEDDAELQAAGSRATEVASAVLAGYGVHGDDLVHAVRIVRSALHGFVSLECSGGFGLPHDADATFDRLVAYLDAGLRGPGDAAEE